MGIPGFYGHWLSNNVKQAVVSGLPQLVSSLSLDFNGIMHQARQAALGENARDPRVLEAIANTPPEQLQLEIFNEVDNILLRIVQAFHPRDTLIIAVDGVAPGAKMQQQKGRREKAAREQLGNPPFNSMVITPGTDFMINMDNHIVRFIGKYRDYLPRKVIYSSHLEPGEGEHKIMDYYRMGEVGDGATVAQGGVHILYGLDADLIMLSLLAPINDIYLSREDVNELVSINVLKEYLMGRSTNPNAVDDFVVMMFLIGNDFLPHIPALEELSETIEMLLEIYGSENFVLTQASATDPERREINWTDMGRFLTMVAQREDSLLAALSVKPFKYPSRFLQGALIDNQFYPQNFRSLWYQNALGTKGTPEFVTALQQIIARYIPNEYDYVLNTAKAETAITTISEVTSQRVERMIYDYMKTMSWIYLYYREGTTVVNHDWAYPYYHTPMLADMAAVVDLQPFQTSGYEAYPGMTVFTALHQLLAVLPVRAQNLLPVEIQSLMDYDSPIRDLYPTRFIIELEGKDRDHEGVPIVPLIDRRRISSALSQIAFNPSRLILWEPSATQRFIRSADEEEHVRTTEFMLQRQLQFQTRQAQRGRGGRGGFRGSGEQRGGGFRGSGDRGDGEQRRGGFRGTGSGFRGSGDRGGGEQRGGGFRGTGGGFRGTGQQGRGTGGGFRGTGQRGGPATQGVVQTAPIAAVQPVMNRGRGGAPRGGRGRGQATATVQQFNQTPILM